MHLWYFSTPLEPEKTNGENAQCTHLKSINTSNPQMVVSKETVGKFWDISNTILGHKYHQNHSDRVISNE